MFKEKNNTKTASYQQIETLYLTLQPNKYFTSKFDCTFLQYIMKTIISLSTLFNDCVVAQHISCYW